MIVILPVINAQNQYIHCFGNFHDTIPLYLNIYAYLDLYRNETPKFDSFVIHLYLKYYKHKGHGSIIQ